MRLIVRIAWLLVGGRNLLLKNCGLEEKNAFFFYFSNSCCHWIGLLVLALDLDVDYFGLRKPASFKTSRTNLH